MSVIKNRALRLIFFIVGCCSVGTGVVGIFVPLLPTTPFILLGAWCFMKSSDRAHQWIYRQPKLGAALKNWDTNRVISRPTKRVALATIILSGIITWIKINVLWISLLVSFFLICISVFIIRANEN